MDIKELTDSFQAFNVNGINNLIYAFTSNWWLLLIVLGAVSTSIMSLVSKIGSTVREEQNII